MPLIQIPSLKHPKTNISHLGKSKIIFTSALGKGYVSSLEGSVILKDIFEDDRAALKGHYYMFHKKQKNETNINNTYLAILCDLFRMVKWPPIPQQKGDFASPGI